MSRFGHILRVIGVAVILTAPSIVRAEAPAPKREAIETQRTLWRGAEAHLSAVRRGHDALAAQIAELKTRDSLSLAQRNELQRLLRQSVGAESELAQAQSAVTAAKARVRDAVRAQAVRIDRRMRALAPKLKTGPVADRKAAARQISSLIAHRKDLRRMLADLDRKAVMPKAWSKYEVAIEPLDGPGELNDKADFVEDMRDKMFKKRAALSRLLREVRQEQEIAQAAQDFTTDVSLFDEETRTARVTRQNGNETAVLNQAGPDTAESTPPPSPISQDGNVADPTTPTTGRQTGDDFSGVDPGTGSTPSLSRDINPDLLINLRVEDLATRGLDPKALNRLVKELEALDAFLKQQARTIRNRAVQLEKSEADALGQ